ncbi:cytochrome P450 [Glomus cerebriforme]|uniref:Cytochrome P450 n=1 Tax=Glomus cerebriforme TaxID=658196 RepID=A0A397SI91_9GLOM|nr:cytochrome P450 [Glomus cerebriforme]
MGILSSLNFGIIEIFFSLSAIYISYYYYKYFTRPNPLPGPFPLPFIGNLYLFNINDFSKFLKEGHEKYGELFEIYFAGDRQICVGNLNVIDKLFNPSSKTNFKFRSLYKPGLDEFGVSGYGVVFNHDYNSWQFNRQFFTQVMLTPSFSQLSLSQSQDFLKVIINYLNDISDKNITFDLRKWMFSFMTDTLLDLFTGKRGISTNIYYSELINKKTIDDEYVELLMKYVDGYTFHLFFGTFAKYIPIFKGIAKNHINNRDKFWNYINNIIIEQKKIIENSPKDQLRDDMITLLLTANTDLDINVSKSRVKDLDPKYQRPLNDKELLINLSEAIGAGVDTIANLFTFLLYYIIKNPEVITKIRAEVIDILGKDLRPIKVEDIDKFKYIEAVIKESSRLSSLTPLIDRYNHVSDEIAGYNWPANTHFIINASGTHSDSKFWENPEKFDPERFIKSSSINNPKAFILFGGGIRICPGRKLAMILLKVLTALLVYKFDFELVKDDPIKIKFAIFNQPDEVNIRIKKREIF